MNKKELRKLQLIELNIIEEVERICKKNNITFYLGEGTLLGAIRHNGFIPWDDDLDILMLRDDYEKFLKIAPKEIDSKFEVQHSTLIHNYWSPFIKIRLLDTSFFTQSHISHITDHNGPLLDIFPIDNVPKQDSLKQKMQAYKIKYYRGIITHGLKLREPKTNIEKIIRILSSFYNIEKVHKKLDKTFKIYNNKNNKFTVNLASYYNYKKQTFPKEYYGKPRLIKFESKLRPVPKEAEKILTTIYGDYMILPPEEKRYGKHNFHD